MEASSRAALAEARERLDQLSRPASGVLEKAKDRLTGQPARAASGPELLALADELFAVGRLLNGQLSLRRALSDPAGRPEDRAALAQRLFGSKVSSTALDMVETVARQRWSHPIDLVDAFAALATEASLDAADARGELDTVEDELFRFGRIVAGDRELGRILSDRKAPAEGKSALLDRLLSGRVSPVTEQLLRNVLTGPHVRQRGERRRAALRGGQPAPGPVRGPRHDRRAAHRRPGAAADRGAPPDLRADRQSAGLRRPGRARRPDRPGGR